MTVTDSNALSVRTETSAELMQAAAIAEKTQEIQAAVILARNFPRNEDAAFASLMRAMKRFDAAEKASYSYKRGRKKIYNERTQRDEWVDNYVTGPSVHLARAAARAWGNVDWGFEITRDDSKQRSIRAWAWDLETNARPKASDSFEKLIQRRKKGAKADTPEAEATEWIVPDERDLRELTNRRAAILVRNVLLEILPPDLIEDARRAAAETVEKKVKDDPEGARKRIILAFSELNVTVPMLETLLTHPIAQCSPAELTKLREIFTSIRDGNSTWAEYVDTENGEKKARPSMRKEDPPPAGDTPPPAASTAEPVSKPAEEWEKEQAQDPKPEPPPAAETKPRVVFVTAVSDTHVTLSNGDSLKAVKKIRDIAIDAQTKKAPVSWEVDNGAIALLEVLR